MHSFHLTAVKYHNSRSPCWSAHVTMCADLLHGLMEHSHCWDYNKHLVDESNNQACLYVGFNVAPLCSPLFYVSLPPIMQRDHSLRDLSPSTVCPQHLRHVFRRTQETLANFVSSAGHASPGKYHRLHNPALLDRNEKWPLCSW